MDTKSVIEKLEDLIKNDTNPRELTYLACKYLDIDKAIYYYDRFMAENPYRNSPLGKVMREDDEV